MSRSASISVLSVALLLAAAGPVLAQGPCPADATRCATIPFTQAYTGGGFSAIDFDTGYVPGGSPLQVRATLHVGGQTSVRLAGTEGVYWQPAIRAGFEGGAGGYVAVDYGLEVHLYVRFDLLGISWSGEIPIPFLPSDLRLSQTVLLDDLVLPGASPRPVLASDVTSRIRVVTFDLLGFLSAIGVGGGVALDVEAMLAATYATERIKVERAPVPITTEGGVAALYPSGTSSDFGPSIDVVAHAEGTLSQVGTVHLYPTVFVSLLGQGFDLDIADLPIDLLRTTRNIVFPDVTHRVALPDLGLATARVEFGTVFVDEVPTSNLVIRNEGSAPLEVEITHSSSVFGLVRTGSFSIGAGASFDLAPVFTPPGPGSYAESVSIWTNDPDMPLRSVTLAGSAIPRPLPMPDAGIMVGDAGLDDGGVELDPRAGLGGCGCVVAGGSNRSPLAGLLAALAVLALAARRARR